MKLYYFNAPDGNFGDDLNPWLFQKLLSNLIDDNSKHLLIGVGTLLNHRIPTAEKVTVFGSGHGYGQKPNMHANWHFSCVRGPRTAEVLGLPAATAITDAAMLTPLFFTDQLPKQYRTAFMPHCLSAKLGDWQRICQDIGIHFIDPRQPFLQVFAQIKQTEHLLTEAMHGAILADAFRVPWSPVKAYPHISEFKWQDWLDSVEVNASFNHISPIYRGDELYNLKDTLKHKLKRVLHNTPLWQPDWRPAPIQKSSSIETERTRDELDALVRQCPLFLSSDSLLQLNTERLLEQAEILRKQYAD